jgi:hypothetical protein
MESAFSQIYVTVTLGLDYVKYYILNLPSIFLIFSNEP